MATENENLKKQVADLSALHEVITNNYHNEQDLFKKYLAVGSKIFNLETGIVSHIDSNIYTILAFTSPLEGLEAGMQFPLEDTYCREVYEANKSVAFPHIALDKKMCNHPVYINMKLEAYISAPIFVNGKLNGTINFTDRKFRDEQFSDFEFQVLEIMANTVGRFLESQQYKSDLSESNRRLNELVGVVSHDLRNPIGNIEGCAEIIREFTDDSQALKYLSFIETCAGDSLEMIENILQISAIRGGKISLKQGDFSVNEIINKAWDTIEFRAIKKKINHSVTYPDNLPTVKVDESRLKQVFENLYTNAIKFSHPGTSIETTVTESDSEILIQVEDYGVGMSPRQIKHIFDGAKTSSTTGTGGETGTGYGIPLVEQIVKLHGGTIDVSSTEGEGTQFRIHLKKYQND